MVKVTAVKTSLLHIPYVKPYYWAQGVIDGAGVVLVEIHTDEGIIGYGESISTPVPQAVEAFIRRAGELCIGRSAFESARIVREANHHLFKAHGTCSSPRFSNQVLAGVEMALWDAAGKIAGRPAHDLLGGAVRDEIAYFGFAQGETAEDVATDARVLVEEGFKVIYIKVGRGDALDLETVSAVRRAIGSGPRLRVDANEHWSALDAQRMIRKLAPFDIEAVEQPTDSESLSAISHVHAMSPIPIVADQVVFTPFDAFDVCRASAADMIVVGPHETGGLTGMAKVAHIAEAAGINICIHGLYESGITTCAANQIGATIPNLDDGNQHMNRFLAWDIIRAPDLRPQGGTLPVLKGPGLGFEINRENVDRARQAFANQSARLLQ